MRRHISANDSSISTTVFSNKTGTGEYGRENNVLIDSDGLVIRYDKTRQSTDLNGVDIGYFFVKKHVLDRSICRNVSFELDILPEFIRQKQLTAYVTNEQYYFITNMLTLKQFEHAAICNQFVPLPKIFFK